MPKSSRILQVQIVFGGAAASAGSATVFAKSECLIAMLTIKNFFIK